MSANAADALVKVIRVLDRLLDPDSGCPWDLKQTPATLRLYLLEETYELLSAVESGHQSEIKEEIGDCLFLLLFLGQLYRKQGLFDLTQVLDAAADKMIARHPHIFEQRPRLEDAEQVKAQWHELKKKEKKGGLLAGVPDILPALLRTHRLTERAGRVGFDWPGPAEVLESLFDEISELKKSLADQDQEGAFKELGDVLFTLANLARHLEIKAEEALRAANDRFIRRFTYIEEKLAKEGQSLDQAALAEMDRLWNEAKAKGL